MYIMHKTLSGQVRLYLCLTINNDISKTILKTTSFNNSSLP